MIGHGVSLNSMDHATWKAAPMAVKLIAISCPAEKVFELVRAMEVSAVETE